MNVPEIAKLCHEVNRAYCLALGDDSHLPWDSAPEWQRDSAVKGVQFHLANDNATPEESHNNWLKGKINDGWVYGPAKDPINKEHPCILAYHMLPAEQRAKDYIFSAIVRSVRAIDAERLGDGVAGTRSVEHAR